VEQKQKEKTNQKSEYPPPDPAGRGNSSKLENKLTMKQAKLNFLSSSPIPLKNQLQIKAVKHPTIINEGTN
jgi:hypothetical protein